MAPILRNRISSPLEAGPSIADGLHLPVYVNEALDYASKRLAKKGANITLLVVRRDYQLPTSTIAASPTFTPGSQVINTALLRPLIPPVSRLEALKQFVKLSNTSSEGSVRERIVHTHFDRFSDGTVSPAFSEASATSSSTYSSVDSTFSSTNSNRFRWPGSPSQYGSSSVPMTPATPFTVMSDNSTNPSSATQQTGMKFIHAHPLSPKDERTLSQTIEKTAKKFKLGSEWLSQPVSASSLSLPPDLIRLSLSQNQTLFSSSHLNLLSLDSLYTFRTAFQAYTRTRSSYRLEDAVDELRRLYLSNGRRSLTKSVLLNSYRWLDPICDHSLGQVCRMYERAYGGNVIRDDDANAAAWPLVAEDKEILFTLNSPTDSETEDDDDDEQDLIDDEKFDIKAIEAWYRTTSIHHQPQPPSRLHPPRHRERETILKIDPLRSHPSNPPHDILLPSPPPPPPPPPIPVRPAPVPIPAERRNITPKLSPAPPGRNNHHHHPAGIQLKLQTTFPKPLPLPPPPPQQSTTSPPIPSPSSNPQQKEEAEEEEEEEEEDLTARPQSAIKTFPPFSVVTRTTPPPSAQWSKTSFSLNEIMLLSPDGGAVTEEAEESGRERERVGPLTPNGYDDISPITRGEWGFLFPVVAERLLRRGPVETCS
ncbi:hypothetical protein QBC40DRAFT_6502 [Triangularia verruculosa]|uniref:DUF7582 domain-containing protein n=1 Tax=Triangularia verruculosa TaxID=2587418 RepID=A0AAN7ARP2_9PEZI|nr:hypothetical protein QBC40DRAFT_6502 [Triangularia verruculosa]